MKYAKNGQSIFYNLEICTAIRALFVKSSPIIMTLGELLDSVRIHNSVCSRHSEAFQKSRHLKKAHARWALYLDKFADVIKRKSDVSNPVSALLVTLKDEIIEFKCLRGSYEDEDEDFKRVCKCI